MYVASVPQLPGCHTDAASLDELMVEIREAIELCLEVQGQEPDHLEFVGIKLDNDRGMSTLPRPAGKELARALERAGFVVERVRGSHYFLRHRMAGQRSFPSHSDAGMGLLRKILSDCGLKPEQLSDLV